jgi:hypothetical protein
MAKVKIRGLDKLNSKLKKIFNANDPALLEEIGKKVVSLIQGFTRSGKSIAESVPQDLKPLSEKYIQKRKSFKNGDPDFFKPTKSNLTLTGQMLKSLDFTKFMNPAKVVIEATGKRNDSNLSNKEVSKFVAEGGRPFLGLHDKGIEQVRQLIIRDLRRKLQSR